MCANCKSREKKKIKNKKYGTYKIWMCGAFSCQYVICRIQTFVHPKWLLWEGMGKCCYMLNYLSSLIACQFLSLRFSLHCKLQLLRFSLFIVNFFVGFLKRNLLSIHIQIAKELAKNGTASLMFSTVNDVICKLRKRNTFFIAHINFHFLPSSYLNAFEQQNILSALFIYNCKQWVLLFFFFLVSFSIGLHAGLSGGSRCLLWEGGQR